MALCEVIAKDKCEKKVKKRKQKALRDLAEKKPYQLLEYCPSSAH